MKQLRMRHVAQRVNRFLNKYSHENGYVIDNPPEWLSRCIHLTYHTETVWNQQAREFKRIRLSRYLKK